jgi:hypothetical protein
MELSYNQTNKSYESLKIIYLSCQFELLMNFFVR